MAIHDAFVVPLLCAECGIPFIGTEILRVVANADGSLARAIAEEAATYRASTATVAQAVVTVEHILDAYQLPRLDHPVTFHEYGPWADAACRAVLASTGPGRPEGAVAVLARAVAQVTQTLALAAMVLRLRCVAPSNDSLRVEDERLRARLRAAVDLLNRAHELSALPERVAEHAEQMAANGRLSLLLDTSDVSIRAGGLRLLERKFAEITREVTNLLHG